MPNYPWIQIGCVSLERATRVTARCCPVLTGSQCQGREGVAEIGAWNYDAHTPNLPSLSEVRDRSYRAVPFLFFLLENPPRVSHHPWVHPYPRSSLRCRVSALLARVPLFSLHPLFNHFSLRLYGYTRMAASPAPSNQKPIICLRKSLYLSHSL